MKKQLLSIILVLCSFVYANAESKFWNFSDDQFSGLGKFTEEIKVDGLTINANPDAAVEVDANKKSIDEYAFTHRMKMGGGGFGAEEPEVMPTRRYLAFNVSGNATITIYGMSSSSGADRTAIVSDGTQILGEVDMLGASISKQVVEYKGSATTIYIYSRTSGINLYAVSYEEGGGQEEPVGVDTFWNFSEDQFSALGKFTEEITVEGLTINANPDAAVEVDANKKSIDEYAFTHRMKMGGGGFGAEEPEVMPTRRYLAFNVSGNATIIIYGMSSSSSADRTAIVSDGTQIVGEVDMFGASISKQVVEYKGSATTIYIYSRTSGINLYGVGVSYAGSASIETIDNIGKEVKTIEYYDLTGKSVRNTINKILIEKKTYTDGSISSQKVLFTE